MADQLSTFGNQLRQSWRFFRLNAKNLFLLSLLPVIPSAIFTILMLTTLLYSLGYADPSLTASGAELLDFIISRLLLAAIVPLTAAILLHIWSLLAAMTYLKHALTGHPISLKAVLKTTLVRLPRFSLLILTCLLLTLGGLVVFIIPGLYFILLTLVAIPLFVDTHTTGLDNLRRCQALCRGKIKSLSIQYTLLTGTLVLFNLAISRLPLLSLPLNPIAFFISTQIFMIFSYLTYQNLTSPHPN